MEITVGIGQLNSTDSIEKNLQQILKCLDDSLKMGKPDICFFPENSLYFRIVEGSEIPGLELSDPAFAELQKWVDAHQVAVHLGSVPLRSGAKKISSSVLLRPNQKIEAGYSKVHLFDIQLTGQKAIKESDAFDYGSGPGVFEYKGFKFGQSICYDIRFSELYQKYAADEVDAILVPAAFLKKTGEAHWHVLNRARAIESQAYVISAAQAGIHNSSEPNQSAASRGTYGHSLLVDPWGEVLWDGPAEGVQIFLATLTKAKIESVRAQIPQKSHRRLR